VLPGASVVGRIAQPVGAVETAPPLPLVTTIHSKNTLVPKGKSVPPVALALAPSLTGCVEPPILGFGHASQPTTQEAA
jgi:hypothetical protein